MFDDIEEVRNVLPVYRWLGSEKDTPSQAQLLDTNAVMLPADFHGRFRDGITLCKLGSL